MDAHCISGATELTEAEIAHAPALYTLYGFVLRWDAVGITLAAEISENGTSYRGLSFIPAGMIKEVVEFKLSVKKPAKLKTPTPQAAPTSQSESSS